MGTEKVAPALPVDELLRISSLLDLRFHILKGDAVVTSKERAFRELFRILEKSGTRYALIGGLAVQLWGEEARTTLDIDVAVSRYEEIPRPVLEAAGFRRLDRHEHSENWIGPDETPVQFSDDPAFAPLVEHAVTRSFEGGRVRVAPAIGLVRSKLRAAADPAGRPSKRLRDLADAQGLLERDPDLERQLSEAERTLLRRAL
ncbi:MAG: nucleotidyl transferase AbiEii/AbiGii toxin family protein [Acidobacteriota bacterium]